MIYIGSARSDENGNLKGGKKGDQKQTKTPDYSGEVSIQEYYEHKKGWRIFRAKDNELRKALAFCMFYACSNKNIGYSQSDRLGAYKEGITTSKKVNCDCSGLVMACLKASGHDLGNFTTANEADVLLKSGLFTEVFNDFKYNGDILVTKTKGHTAIITSGAVEATVNKRPNPNPYPEPKTILKKGSKGDDVKWLQVQINYFDYSLSVDGVFGPATLEAVIKFQKAHKLEPDGIVGAKTLQALRRV